VRSALTTLLDTSPSSVKRDSRSSDRQSLYAKEMAGSYKPVAVYQGRWGAMGSTVHLNARGGSGWSLVNGTLCGKRTNVRRRGHREAMSRYQVSLASPTVTGLLSLTSTPGLCGCSGRGISHTTSHQRPVYDC
jgi:hypothetical protein